MATTTRSRRWWVSPIHPDFSWAHYVNLEGPKWHTACLRLRERNGQPEWRGRRCERPTPYRRAADSSVNDRTGGADGLGIQGKRGVRIGRRAIPYGFVVVIWRQSQCDASSRGGKCKDRTTSWGSWVNGEHNGVRVMAFLASRSLNGCDETVSDDHGHSAATRLGQSGSKETR